MWLQSVQNCNKLIWCWDVLLCCCHMQWDPVWWRNKSGDKYVFKVLFKILLFIVIIVACISVNIYWKSSDASFRPLIKQLYLDQLEVLTILNTLYKHIMFSRLTARSLFVFVILQVPFCCLCCLCCLCSFSVLLCECFLLISCSVLCHLKASAS